ncbi:MAG: diaminopimelate decarboxylase [Deltaproteobacteria bacterium]|nr:diaminopimelate decarboxylase [Deltaproteobacteria bacterium]
MAQAKKMDHITTLVERYFNSPSDELHIGKIQVSAIVAEYGTPLFIYDRQILDQKWRLLRDSLPSEIAISYSVKANPNRTILQYFVSKGCGLEIASGGELYQALKAGCSPNLIVFAGPGKTEAELEFALTQGIVEIHVESILEVERVNAISRRLGVRGRIALRVNPAEEAQGGAMRMGGKPAPFGIDEEGLDFVLERVRSEPFIEFRGIHLFVGTQILDHRILLDQYHHGVELARRVAGWLEHPLQTVDFGGGFGIPYFAHEQELDMQAFGKGLAALMTEVKNDSFFSETQFMVEPGRFLVGEAGIYVVRINDIKVSRSKKFVIVDGGMHHHLAASGNLGQTIKRNYPIAVLNRLNTAPEEKVDVVGPLCTPLDVLGRAVVLPKAEVGDLIGIFQSGAYARTASPLGFLSHPTPPEIWVEEGQAHLIRRRGKNKDFFEDHCNLSCENNG